MTTPSPMAASGDAQGDAAPTVVIFDIGEVIIDETRVWAVWAELLGVSPLTFGAILGAAIAQGLGWRDAMQEVAPNIDPLALEDEHERRYGGFREEDLYADVRTCLHDLRRAGRHVVLAGNQPARRTAQLRALDLPVDALATSEDLGAAKPDRAFWDATLALAGAPPPSSAMYVGDRVDNDILPAAAMGMPTCWIRRGPWGRLQDMPDDAEPADLVLEGLGELPTLLDDW